MTYAPDFYLSNQLAMFNTPLTAAHRRRFRQKKSHA
jgi:hypothetical protein